jgi:hypothetical protein
LKHDFTCKPIGVDKGSTKQLIIKKTKNKRLAKMEQKVK